MNEKLTTISQNNLTIAENEQKVYDSGYRKAVKDCETQVLKGSASGEIVSIKDVSPVEHKMDVEVSSKNLIKYPYDSTTMTVGGVTFTDNGDGSITLNGTSTEMSSFYFRRLDSTYNPFVDGQSYTIGKIGDNVSVVVNYLDENGVNRYNNSNFKWNNQYVLKYLYIQTQKDKTFENYTVFPQIEEGTVATDYTPYVDNIEDVKLYKTGKNLLDDSIILKANGFSQTADGYYTGSASALYYAFNRVSGSVGSLYTDFKPNTQYTFSLVGRNSSKNENTAAFYFVYSDGTTSKEEDRIYLSSTTNTALELVSERGKTVVGLHATYFHTDILYLKDFQLEVGTYTDYEPYIEPVEVNKDEVTSLYPTTTLYSDTKGVLIEAEYNRDINKAFEELTNAIISLGGNI